MHPHPVSRRDLAEPLGPRARDGLGALADLFGRALPGPDFGQRRQVRTALGGTLEQADDLPFVGDDVVAGVGLT